MIRRTWSWKNPKVAEKSKAGANVYVNGGKPKRRTLEEMTHGELEHLLDHEISFQVRAGAAHELGMPFVPCYTCGNQVHWKRLDAGHYIGRSNRGTRFDLRNIRPQCTKCNSFEEGQHWKFRQALVIELGEAEVKSLELAASLWGSAKHAKEWLIEQIGIWRTENKKIKGGVDDE
jgi:hypothetical protein